MNDSSDFWNRLDALKTEAHASEDGKTFVDAGFHLAHMGGGCTAWMKTLPDDRWILITDSEGVGHTLSTESANDPSKPDNWLIGIHDEESDGDYLEAATAIEAVAAALAILFRQKVREHTSSECLAEIDRRNASRDDCTCATHDFSDANMFMLDAWRGLFGRDSFPDTDSESDAALWNRAWSMAKAHGFSSPTN